MIYNPYMPQSRADEWTDSELNPPQQPTDGEDWPDERGDEQCESMLEWIERTQLVKPTGHCVTIPDANGVVWKV